MATEGYTCKDSTMRREPKQVAAGAAGIESVQCAMQISAVVTAKLQLRYFAEPKKD